MKRFIALLLLAFMLTTQVVNATFMRYGIIASSGAAAPFHTESVDLNGTNEYMANTTNNTIDIANDFTVNLWVNLNGLGDADFINLSNSANNNDTLAIDFALGEPRALLFGSGGTLFKNYSSNTTLTTGTEYMITVTWDGTDLEIYLNGSTDTPYTKTTDNLDEMSTNTRRVYLGSEVGANFLNGKYAVAAIWSEALPAAAITAIYDDGNGNELDLRVSTGSYTQTATLEHFWPLCNDTADIGQDLGGGTNIDVDTNALNISAADCGTF